MVFNTPSVHNCHGWKLGEYLAMGKAIISTPISNELPEELKHGENIHIIQTTRELENAVSLLLTDKDYREKLSRGASTYYSKYASPELIIQNLIQN
jgi:glycosyltransferase involved in cell wall biosynthesis